MDMKPSASCKSVVPVFKFGFLHLVKKICLLWARTRTTTPSLFQASIHQTDLFTKLRFSSKCCLPFALEWANAALLHPEQSLCLVDTTTDRLLFVILISHLLCFIRVLIKNLVDKKQTLFKQDFFLFSQHKVTKREKWGSRQTTKTNKKLFIANTSESDCS